MTTGEDLHRRYRHLLGLQRRLAAERQLHRLAARATAEISEFLEADRSSLFLLDWETMQLTGYHAEGLADNALVVPLRMGLIGTAIIRRQVINVVNAYQHPCFNPEIDAGVGYKTDNLLAVPLTVPDGGVLGGIELLNSDGGRFTESDEAAAGRCADRLARLLLADELDTAIAEAALAELHGAIGFHRGSIFVLDEPAGQLFAICAEGSEGRPIVLNLKLGIAGLVALTGERLRIADVAADSRFDASVDRRTGYRTRTMICQPLFGTHGEILGVVQAINKLDGEFDDQDGEVLESVAAVVGIAVENALLLRDAERQFHSLLETLAASIDARDALTAGHSRRVAVIAAAIGHALGFADTDLDVLQVAAILHDYGKIGVDDAVLRKNGKLDEEEFRHMKKHAGATFDILERIYFARKYRGVPLIASSHHECPDGSGYPRGLTNHEIPFMTKILTVADVYEALTADRHYRQGMAPEQALAILDRGIGDKFDAAVVAALKQCLAAGAGFALPGGGAH